MTQPLLSFDDVGPIVRRRQGDQRRVVSTSAPANSSRSSARTAPGKRSIFNVPLRRVPAPERPRHVRRSSPHRQAPHDIAAARHRPDVPEHRVVPAADRARQPHARSPPPHAATAPLPPSRGRAPADEEPRNREAVEEIMDFLEIEHRARSGRRRCRTASRSASNSGARSRCDPKLLLLDEPVAGMNLEETEDMARFILDIRKSCDIPQILVEHDMGVVMDIADRVMVVDFGRRSRSGTPARRAARPAVIKAYLGGELRRRASDRVAVSPRHDRAPHCQRAAQTTRRPHPCGQPRAGHGRDAARSGSAFGGRSPGPSTGTACPTSALGLARARHEARRPRRDPQRGPPRVGVSPTLGAVASGGVTVGMYPTNPAAEVEYLAVALRREVLVAEDQEQVDKALVSPALPRSRGSSSSSRAACARYDDPRLIPVTERLEPLGERTAPRIRRRDERIDVGAKPDEIGMIVYTRARPVPRRAPCSRVSESRERGDKIVRRADSARRRRKPTTESCRTCRCAISRRRSSRSRFMPPPASGELRGERSTPYEISARSQPTLPLRRPADLGEDARRSPSASRPRAV